MKRPYFVRTPRNIYGESLVHPCNNVCYEILSYYTGGRIYAEIKDLAEVKAEAERLNDAHEVEMARAMHI